MRAARPEGRRPVGALALLGLIALTLTALGIGAYVLSRDERPAPLRASLSLAAALGSGESAGFARALAPHPFTFPVDHGPHPAYRTEWWYYTGNVATADGRHFGFQLVIFRTALAPRPVERPSAWGATQVYLAHFAVTDVAGGRFHAVERVSRAALGLAGAELRPLRVWLEDWSVEGRGGDALPMRLRAAHEGVAIDLVLDSAKPPVLHGDRGLSQKSGEPGNASYYYSLSRMPTHGTIRIGGGVWEVRGLSWMDREWSTSALARDQVGWDWFGLQLGDGREVMLYRLRRRDGSIDPLSRGTLVRPDGGSRPLAPGDVTLEVLDRWTSPRDGARYPGRWRLRVPADGLDLLIAPYLTDQELDLAIRYWEGAVRVSGTAGDRRVIGEGYVELTGYAQTGGELVGRAGGS